MANYRSGLAAALLACALWVPSGCVSVRAPKEINVGTSDRKPVDAERIPPTSTHEEARYELARAYEEIRSLRRKVEHLEKDKRELKQDLDELEDERDDDD